MPGSKGPTQPSGEITCPNCGRAIKDDEMFCSSDCEREWMARELAKTEFEGIVFCPSCGSTRMTSALPGLISTWVCKECGYTGGLAIKDGEMRKAIRKRYEEARGTRNRD